MDALRISAPTFYDPASDGLSGKGSNAAGSSHFNHVFDQLFEPRPRLERPYAPSARANLPPRAGADLVPVPDPVSPPSPAADDTETAAPAPRPKDPAAAAPRRPARDDEAKDSRAQASEAKGSDGDPTAGAADAPAGAETERPSQDGAKGDGNEKSKPGAEAAAAAPTATATDPTVTDPTAIAALVVAPVAAPVAPVKMVAASPLSASGTKAPVQTGVRAETPATGATATAAATTAAAAATATTQAGRKEEPAGAVSDDDSAGEGFATVLGGAGGDAKAKTENAAAAPTIEPNRAAAVNLVRPTGGDAGPAGSTATPAGTAGDPVATKGNTAVGAASAAGADPTAVTASGAGVDQSRRLEGSDFSGHLNAVRGPRGAAPAGVPEQVSINLQQGIRDGKDRIAIQLRPEELGRIEIELKIAQDGTVQAIVAADRPQTLELLQRDSRGLERALQDAGLQTDSNSLSFNLRGGGNQSSQQSSDGNGAAGDRRGRGGGRDDAEPVVAKAAARSVWLTPGRVDVTI